MNLIDNSRKYLENFFNGHYQDYFEAMNEYRPQKGYGNFPNSSDIVQCMRDITHIIEDELSDLKIPEHFATPRHLIGTISNLISILKSYEPKFNETIEHYKDPNHIPVPVYEINKRRLETIEACEHFILLANEELKQNLTTENEMNEFEKISIGQLFQYIKRLKISSFFFILGIIGIIITITIFGTKSENNIRISDLTQEVKVYSKESVKSQKVIDSLKNVIAKKDIEIDTIQNQLRVLKVNYKGLLNNKFAKVSISYFKPISIFNGHVLIKAIDGYEKKLNFQGIKGIDKDKIGDFEKDEIIVEEGDRFYLIDEEDKLWAINVIRTSISIDIEMVPLTK